MPVIKVEKQDGLAVRPFDIPILTDTPLDGSKDVSSFYSKFEQVLIDIEKSRNEMLRANERVIIELVYRIAKIILLKEISVDRNYIIRLAEYLIDRLDVRDNIQIQINHVDFKSFDLIKQELEKKFGPLKNLNIEACDLLQNGGCYIRTEWNAVDASVETQLNGIYESLLGKL